MPRRRAHGPRAGDADVDHGQLVRGLAGRHVRQRQIQLLQPIDRDHAEGAGASPVGRRWRWRRPASPAPIRNQTQQQPHSKPVRVIRSDHLHCRFSSQSGLATPESTRCARRSGRADRRRSRGRAATVSANEHRSDSVRTACRASRARLLHRHRHRLAAVGDGVAGGAAVDVAAAQRVGIAHAVAARDLGAGRCTWRDRARGAPGTHPLPTGSERRRSRRRGCSRCPRSPATSAARWASTKLPHTYASSATASNAAGDANIGYAGSSASPAPRWPARWQVRQYGRSTFWWKSASSALAVPGHRRGVAGRGAAGGLQRVAVEAGQHRRLRAGQRRAGRQHVDLADALLLARAHDAVGDAVAFHEHHDVGIQRQEVRVARQVLRRIVAAAVAGHADLRVRARAQRVEARPVLAIAAAAVDVELHLVRRRQAGTIADADGVARRLAVHRRQQRELLLTEAGAVVGDVARRPLQLVALRIVSVDELRAGELAAERELVAVVVDDDAGAIAEVLQRFTRLWRRKAEDALPVGERRRRGDVRSDRLAGRADRRRRCRTPRRPDCRAYRRRAASPRSRDRLRCP